MKMPAFLVTAVALSACSTSAPVGQSAETPLNPYENLDVAEGTVTSGDATCDHGFFDQDRTFIICEDGALRTADLVAVLSAPHNPNLRIEDVAEAYNVPTQIFGGIESATYGTLINGNRQAPRRNVKRKPRTDVTQIEGKLYDLYRLSAGGKTGTIFIEQTSEK